MSHPRSHPNKKGRMECGFFRPVGAEFPFRMESYHGFFTASVTLRTVFCGVVRGVVVS